MTEINYQELNRKILDIIKREPVNFAWVLTPVPGSHGMKYEHDYAYIEFPCGGFKKLRLEFTVVNPLAKKEHFAYVLTEVGLSNLFGSYKFQLNKITNHNVLVHRLTEHAQHVLDNINIKVDSVSLKFNRVVNKLIAAIK